jgi:hypothetical protein
MAGPGEKKNKQTRRRVQEGNAKHIISSQTRENEAEENKQTWKMKYLCVLAMCIFHHEMKQPILHICRDKSNLGTGLDKPGGFQQVQSPRFQDNKHMKVVRLSALRTGRLYPPGDNPGTHFS